jgi:tetratricopeptide (TPR) repeat protein
MGPLRVAVHQHEHFRIASPFIALVLLFVANGLWAQSPNTGDATLQGVVRDPHNQPASAAIVFLQAKSGTETLTARTDSKGAYRLSVPPGTYTMRAELTGCGETTFGSVVLGPREARTIDLTLATSRTSGSQTAAATTPEFFDQPQFTVAGVTDPTNLGGHGSDTVVRTRESLAKETASLNVASSKTSPASQADSSHAAAEKSLRDAAAHDPNSFGANYRLGKMLVEEEKAIEGIPYLERATHLGPADYESAYELALAYADAGRYDDASKSVRNLLAQQDNAELHHLLGDVEEKQNHPLEAVREYQRAAEADPREQYLFDWGAELLMHRAIEPAIEVFTKGNHQFPQSARMLVGLGVAWYARGSYDHAARRLSEAADLNPADPTAYLFMGKMQSALATQPEQFADRLARFAKLQPDNALANYYYAVSLWKQRKSDDTEEAAHVESLLQKAAHLDPKLSVAFLQLGILYSEQKEFSKAIAAFQEAIAANPQTQIEEAHYRLSQAYRQIGDRSKAAQELRLYQQISKESESQFERQRHEIQQFVYTLRTPTSASPQQ